MMDLQPVPEWGFAADAEFVTGTPDDPSTVLGAGAFGAVFAATLRGLPAAAKTLHALQNPIMYGLVGPNADPAAVQAVPGLASALTRTRGKRASLRARRIGKSKRQMLKQQQQLCSVVSTHQHQQALNGA